MKFPSNETSQLLLIKSKENNPNEFSSDALN